MCGVEVIPCMVLPITAPNLGVRGTEKAETGNWHPQKSRVLELGVNLTTENRTQSFFPTCDLLTARH